MKRWKKALSCVLALIMIVCMLPVSAMAAEKAALEDVTFACAFEVQRDPLYPTWDQTITVSKISSFSRGALTLSKAGSYAHVKAQGLNSGSLDTTVLEVAMEYGFTPDSIMIHELKDGETHIAYGVVAAFDGSEYALFLGDTLEKGRCYLLSKAEFESTLLSVVLTSAGPNKVKVIKLIKEVTGLGLRDSKDLMDNAPSVVKDGFSMDEASELAGRFREIGAEVEITGYAPYSMNAQMIAPDFVETAKVEDVTFGYAYDAQGEPAYPGRDQILGMSDSNPTCEGSALTLSQVGGYAYVKEQNLNSSKLDAIVSEVAEAYGLSACSVMIHELKDGETHIAYGVITAFDGSEHAVFLGDTLEEGRGYLLSKAELKSTLLSVVLTSAGPEKVKVIKLIKEVTGLGLRDSKDLMDNAPSVVKEGIPANEAYELADRFRELGAEVEVRHSFAAPPTPDVQTPCVVLTSAGPEKVKVIKLVRDVRGLGLKDAKDLVDNVPSVVKDNLSIVEAYELADQFRALGATVEVKLGELTDITYAMKARTIAPDFATSCNEDNPPDPLDGLLGGLLGKAPSQVLGSFVDVTPMDYYYDAVNWAVENDITTGTGRLSFSPDEPCTRAQAVTFLWRAAGCPAPADSATPFVDVEAGSYYEKAVAWAVENGVTNGTSAATFSPYASCTRAQIVTFLYRTFGAPVDAAASFTDVAADAYYAPAVAWAAANRVTGGTAPAVFSPDAVCTRAQIVTFLYRCRG